MFSKIISSILIIGGFILLNFSTPIYAEKITVLSDAELDNISAGGIDIDINAAEAFRSAVVSQSNIGAFKGFSLNNISLNNYNLSAINNTGNSAVGLQSNIAAVVAQKGDIKAATINNNNTATINNTGSLEGALSASLANINAPLGLVTINRVYADKSAVASQSNIAVIAALEGNIKDSLINNKNFAALTNFGNSAVASQSNIAVVVARGNIDNTTINNLNEAIVTNTGLNTALGGGAQVQNFNYSGLLGSLQINHLSVAYSAEAAQSNIAIVLSLGGGNVSNTHINSSNIATVINTNP